MVYRRLADLVVAIHTLISVFFLFGAFLCWRYPRVALIHVPLAAWVTPAFIMGWTCPLTPLENHLRRAGGLPGYEGGFIEHYLGPLIARPPAVNAPASPGSNRQAEIALGVIFGVLSLLLHGLNFAQYHDAITRLFH